MLAGSAPACDIETEGKRARKRFGVSEQSGARTPVQRRHSCRCFFSGEETSRRIPARHARMRASRLFRRSSAEGGPPAADSGCGSGSSNPTPEGLRRTGKFSSTAPLLPSANGAVMTCNMCGTARRNSTPSSTPFIRGCSEQHGVGSMPSKRACFGALSADQVPAASHPTLEKRSSPVSSTRRNGGCVAGTHRRRADRDIQRSGFRQPSQHAAAGPG